MSPGTSRTIRNVAKITSTTVGIASRTLRMMYSVTWTLLVVTGGSANTAPGVNVSELGSG